jgi:hypothetical protein
MAAKGTTKAEIDQRIRQFVQIIANGGRRSDCLQYASKKWGVTDRTADSYLAKARDQLKADWDLERARKAKQYHIALGAINTAAKLAQLCS